MIDSESKNDNLNLIEQMKRSTELERPHLFMKKQNKKPACENKSVWTGDKDRSFVVRIYNFLKHDSNSVNAINNVSCILKYGNQEKESAVFKRNPSRDLQTKEVKSKNITKRNTKRVEKPSSSKNNSSKTLFDKSFNEVVFDYEDADQNVEVRLYDRKKKRIIGTTSVKEVDKNCWKIEGVIENKEVKEQLSTKKPLYCSVKNSSKTNISVEEIPVLLYTGDKLTHNTKSCNTLPINHVMSQIIGVDMDKTSTEELQYKLRDKITQDAYTSPIPYESTSQASKTILTNEEVDTIKTKHEEEIRQVHADYERKMKKLVYDLDELRQKQIIKVGDHNETTSPLSGKSSTRKSDLNKSSKNVENSLTVSQFKWGDDLPKNVWERMKILTDEMVNNRQK